MTQRISLFQAHVARWSNCTRCALHETRQHVVLARGKIPADILIVGEGPGQSEDALGQPFVGPAGALLDHVIASSIGDNGAEFRYAVTNAVACLPTDEDGVKAHVPPDMVEIAACAPRLQEFYAMVQPRLLVCVGATARDYLDIALPKKFRGDVLVCAIKHPAAIIRVATVIRGLEVQRCIVAINQGLDELRARDAAHARRFTV